MQVVRAGTRAAGVLDQPSEDGLCTDSTGPPGKALSPQLDISTSSASDRPPASAPTKAADISAEVEKLQVCPSSWRLSYMRSEILSVLGIPSRPSK